MNLAGKEAYPHLRNSEQLSRQGQPSGTQHIKARLPFPTDDLGPGILGGKVFHISKVQSFASMCFVLSLGSQQWDYHQ